MTAIPQSQATMSAWCSMAEVSLDDNQIGVRRLLGETTCESHLNLTNSADWMEYMDQGYHNSAYDTFRCDWIVQSKKWNVWGYDFHVERLAHSFQTLVESSPGTIEKAQIWSNKLFQALLDEAGEFYAADEEERTSTISINEVAENVQIHMVRFTFLWTPILKDGAASIRVCGHAYCSGNQMFIRQLPDPIVASLDARLVTSSSDGHNRYLKLDSSSPHRFDHHPWVKQSAWTRDRKPLRKKEQEKYRKCVKPSNKNLDVPELPPTIGEVLLLREAGSKKERVELLEGLSSNVFVVFRDGTLGTAQDDAVLPGYVRHLVLQDCASTRPILLDGATTTDWREVFITSSSRLVIPIERIVVLDEEGQWADVWSSTPPPPGGVCKWQELREALLQSHGY